jgi:hypothetical protein
MTLKAATWGLWRRRNLFEFCLNVLLETDDSLRAFLLRGWWLNNGIAALARGTGALGHTSARHTSARHTSARHGLSKSLTTS